MRRIIKDHSDLFSLHQFPPTALCTSPRLPPIAIPDATCVVRRASTLAMRWANWGWKAIKETVWIVLIIFCNKIRLLGIDFRLDVGSIGYNPALLLQQDIDHLQPCPEFVAIQDCPSVRNFVYTTHSRLCKMKVMSNVTIDTGNRAGN